MRAKKLNRLQLNNEKFLFETLKKKVIRVLKRERVNTLGLGCERKRNRCGGQC